MSPAAAKGVVENQVLAECARRSLDGGKKKSNYLVNNASFSRAVLMLCVREVTLSFHARFTLDFRREGEV